MLENWTSGISSTMQPNENQEEGSLVEIIGAEWFASAMLLSLFLSFSDLVHLWLHHAFSLIVT